MTLCALCLALLFVASDAAIAQPWASDEWLRRPVDAATFGRFQGSYAYDRALPFDVQRRPAPASEGLRRERISFRTAGDQRVTGLITRTTRAGAGWVIFLHGGSGLGKDTPAYVASMQVGLARGGWNVLAIDMQHFGERRTGLLTTFTAADRHDRLYNHRTAQVAWVTQTVKDVGRSRDLLIASEGADSTRIALVGHSRGALMAMISGAADPRLAAVAALWGGHFTFAERGHDAQACPANYIGRIAPRPLLMVNGTADVEFDRTLSVLPLQRHAKAPVDTIWVPEGHVVPSPEVTARIGRWLDGKLPARAGRR